MDKDRAVLIGAMFTLVVAGGTLIQAANTGIYLYNNGGYEQVVCSPTYLSYGSCWLNAYLWRAGILLVVFGGVGSVWFLVSQRAARKYAGIIYTALSHKRLVSL